MGVAVGLQACLPRELEHRAQLVRRVAGDGARRQQVARPHVAAGDGVMHELLLAAPVHVLVVGLGDGGRRRARARRDLDGERDVVGRVAGVLQVGQRRWVGLHPGARRAREGRERVDGHHPGRDGGREVLGAKRAERHVLELLDVARAPVVTQHEAEDALGRLIHRQRRAERRRVTAHKEPLGLGVGWGLGLGLRLGLRLGLGLGSGFELGLGLGFGLG